MFQFYISAMLIAPILCMFVLGSLKLLEPANLDIKSANLCIWHFFFLSVISLGAVGILMLDGPQTLMFSNWMNLKGYHFDLTFILNWESILFTLVSSVLYFTISFFSRSYLHGEEGPTRYYFLLLLFALGTFLIALTTSIDIIYAGWELVGISSVLLIGYFNRRIRPVQNALKVFRIYKLCDVALLSAAIWLHVFFHTASLTQLPDHGSAQLTLIAFFIVFASLGKSAQFPFCNWLTMAIEGPTPSSTIFYGSISTHLGALLLLKAWPIISLSIPATIFIFVVGLISALYATLVGRVQADIKSSLAYSTVSQVGIIYMEIGLGFTYLAFVHILLHMCYRTYQFLWSPSIIDEYNLTEMAAQTPNLVPGKHFSFLPIGLKNKIYFLSLNKFHLNKSWTGLLTIFGDVISGFLRTETSLVGTLESGDPSRYTGPSRYEPTIKLLNIIFFILTLIFAYLFYANSSLRLDVFYSKLQLLISTIITWLIVANLDESDGKSVPLLLISAYLINLVSLTTENPVLYYSMWVLMPVPVIYQVYISEKRKFALFTGFQVLSTILLLLGILSKDSWGIISGSLIFISIMIRQAEFPFHSWLVSIRHSKFLPLITQFLFFNSGITLYLSYQPGSLSEFSTAITVIAMVSGLYLAALAWRSENFIQKAILIVFSQSSLILSGVKSFSESAIGGSIIYQFAHSIAGACFLIVLNSMIKHKRITEGNQFYGIGHKQPLHAVIFLLNGLVLVGCPLTLGFIGEDVLFHTLLESYPLLGFNLIVLTALNGFNVLKLYSEIFLGPEYRQWIKYSAKRREVLCYIISFLILIGFGLMPTLFVGRLDIVLK